MRFSSIVVLAAVAPVATGFTPFQRQFTAPRTIAGAVQYDLDLGIEPAPKKGSKKAAPAPAPAPAPEPEPAPAPKSKKRSAKKEEPKPAPAPAPEPAPKAKAKAKKVVEPKPAPVKKVKPEPVKVVPPPPPAKSASASTKAGGVALGAAPLILAPAAILAGGRSILTGTLERREKIQKEIEEFEAAKKKKQLQAEVDGGELAKAAVSSSLFEINGHFFPSTIAIRTVFPSFVANFF